MLVAQIKKLKKADWHLFGQMGLVETFPTQIQIHKHTNTHIHKYTHTDKHSHRHKDTHTCTQTHTSQSLIFVLSWTCKYLVTLNDEVVCACISGRDHSHYLKGGLGLTRIIFFWFLIKLSWPTKLDSWNYCQWKKLSVVKWSVTSWNFSLKSTIEI